MQSKVITIEPRFNGPPDTANGGYTAGLLASVLGGDAKVILRKPPPLNTELEIAFDKHLATLNNDTEVVANAQKVKLKVDVPDCPPTNLVEAAASDYKGASNRLLSSCFVCGPDRDNDDGLNIFPVPVKDHDCVASLWHPNTDLATQDGLLPPEIIWAALDCPGYFAHQQTDKLMLLGSMTSVIQRRPSASETLTSVGWRTGVEGRKYHSGTALYDSEGNVCAASSQVWITLKD